MIFLLDQLELTLVNDLSWMILFEHIRLFILKYFDIFLTNGINHEMVNFHYDFYLHQLLLFVCLKYKKFLSAIIWIKGWLFVA